jgi:hypothetical protein
MATIRRWTKDEIARLRSLAQKQRAADIAAGLGRSSSSIAVKAHQLGLSLKVLRHGNDNVKQPSPEILGNATRHREGNEMRSPKKTPKSALFRHSTSHRALLEKMSKVISLRERVAQAELELSALRLIKDAAMSPADEPRS